jgi:hypothetical protein
MLQAQLNSTHKTIQKPNNTNESQIDKIKEQEKEKEKEKNRSHSTTPSCNELMLTPAFSAIGPGYLAVDWTGWSISDSSKWGRDVEKRYVPLLRSTQQRF